MKRFISIFNILVLILIINKIESLQFDNDTVTDLLGNEGMTPMQVAKKYGYPFETHWVITEDGYIIKMHRVPYGINSTDRSNRPPIIIGHGMGGTSIEYFIFGHKSMGFSLVEAGYDVWVGNARGTRWSRRHKTLSPRSKAFWMFSFEEIGTYDYYAEINYVINVTRHEKVFFIGHSQGGGCFVVLAAERPEINDKIRLAILMGPTIFTKNMKSPLLLVGAANIAVAEGFFDYIQMYEFPSGPFLRYLITELCKGTFSFLCVGILNLLMGYDYTHIDRRLVPLATSNLPGGLSIRQAIHFAQVVNSKRFQKYDYGPEENLRRYGSKQPPLYNISKITAPVALMHSINDPYIDMKDAQDLVKALPNCAFDYVINKPLWNHVAFLVAVDANEVAFQKIIEMMRQY